jgi:hypothetical protein
MPGLAHYMAQYDHEHTSGWNKFLHAAGIPLIFAGMILLVLMKWVWGASFFVAGWALLLIGHRIEGNHPARFFRVRYTCWLVQFGSRKKHGCSSQGQGARFGPGRRELTACKAKETETLAKRRTLIYG